MAAARAEGLSSELVSQKSLSCARRGGAGAGREDGAAGGSWRCSSGAWSCWSRTWRPPRTSSGPPHTPSGPPVCSCSSSRAGARRRKRCTGPQWRWSRRGRRALSYSAVSCLEGRLREASEQLASLQRRHDEATAALAAAPQRGQRGEGGGAAARGGVGERRRTLRGGQRESEAGLRDLARPQARGGAGPATEPRAGAGGQGDGLGGA